MKRYAGFLRAVNVGGTTKLPMAELRALCGEIGFDAVETYIASGNIAFCCNQTARDAEMGLEAALLRHLGKPVAVFVRDARDMQRIVSGNPYADRDPSRTMAFLMKAAPPDDLRVSGRKDEMILAGEREIYVHYPDGIGRSKLKIPAANDGTSRNMNTLAALAKMVAGE